MATQKNSLIIAGSLACCLATVILACWLSAPTDLGVRMPGDDRPGYSHGEQEDGSLKLAPIGRDFRQYKPFLPSDAAISGTWANFRGTNHQNSIAGGTALSDLSDFRASRVLWQVTLGEGHAGAAVADGRVYILDYDELAKAEALRCLALRDGSEIWRRSWPIHMKRNHGYSRTVPAIYGEYVVTVGPLGHVMCVDRLTGDLLWSLDPSQKWHGSVPLWYGGQCPLVVNGTLVLAVGGDVLMAGIDISSGAVQWASPNPGYGKTTHASVMPMVFGDSQLFLACFSNGLFGISANGKVLFRVPDWTVQVEVPSPVVLPGNRVYLTAGYGAGNMMLQLSRESDGGIAVGTVFRNEPGKALSCEQQTPIPLGDRLIGIQTKDAGAEHDQLVCMGADGAMLWTSGKTRRFGLGPYIMADNKIFVLGEDGWLTVVEAQTREYRELSRNRVFVATDAWAPMALAGSRLLLRDKKTLVCLDLRKDTGS